MRDALSLLDQLRAFTADAVDDEAVATVLGVPSLEVTTRLIEVLAAGETAVGLGLLRERLAAGQDASILYQEMGRTLRTLVYLTLDPALVPTLTQAQIERLQPIAQTYGADTLTRMLGLWVEHDLPGQGGRQPRTGPRGRGDAPRPLARGPPTRGLACRWGGPATGWRPRTGEDLDTGCRWGSGPFSGQTVGFAIGSRREVGGTVGRR